MPAAETMGYDGGCRLTQQPPAIVPLRRIALVYLLRGFSICAWAAASLAMGTRKGEQLT